MNIKRTLALSVVALVAMTANLSYGRTSQALTEFLAEALEYFNSSFPGQQAAMQFAHEDINGDNIRELLLANADHSIVVAFDTDEKLQFLRRVNFTPTGKEDFSWLDMSYLWNQFNDLEYATDLTLRYQPLFVTPNFATNRYTVFHDMEYDDVVNPAAYDRMIFKPHVNAVKYTGTKSGMNGHQYSLVDPKVVKTMFRGYKDHEAMPFIVPHEFLDHHNVLQFSRWLAPEPIVKLSDDNRKIVENHYKGYEIEDSRWLATCPTAERTFYAVTFKPRQGDDYVLASIVCIAEGFVSTTLETRGYIEDGQSMWFGDTDYFDHAPEIMAMTASEQGFEFYCRWPSMEGTHYSIYREVMDHFVLVSDEYEYWQF